MTKAQNLLKRYRRIDSKINDMTDEINELYEKTPVSKGGTIISRVSDPTCNKLMQIESIKRNIEKLEIEREEIITLISTLSEDEQDVIMYRYLNRKNHIIKVIADKMYCSPRRVSYLQKSALEKIGSMIK